MEQAPTPFGLRAYKKPDGSYGGEMMPKGYGWLGLIPNPKGGVSSELSSEDDVGSFPLMAPTLTKKQLNTLLNLPERKKVPEDIYKSALDWANFRRSQNLSPFKEIWDK